MTTIYRGAHPHRIESVWGTKGEYHCRTNAGHVYRIENVAGCTIPGPGDDVRTTIGGPRFIFGHQSDHRRAAKPVEPFVHVKAEPVKASPIEVDAPHFRTDAEWYENTAFPGEPAHPDFPRRVHHCYTSGETWPLGRWLAAPYVKA